MKVEMASWHGLTVTATMGMVIAPSICIVAFGIMHHMRKAALPGLRNTVGLVYVCLTGNALFAEASFVESNLSELFEKHLCVSSMLFRILPLTARGVLPKKTFMSGCTTLTP